MNSPTPVPTNVKYQCEATLGSPSTANCEAVLYEFLRDGEIVLDPTRPIIKRSGMQTARLPPPSPLHQIRIPDHRLIDFQEIAQSALVPRTDRAQHGTSSAASPKSSSCNASADPWPGKSAAQPPAGASPLDGGKDRLVCSRPRTNHTRADTATATTALFPFQLSVYLQPPFNGAADQTCPWGVVSSHQGDVRQCPATTDFWRPPARRLGSTVFHSGDITAVLNDTSLEIGGPNFTEIVRGNATNLLAAAQALIPSASLADAAPSAAAAGLNDSAAASTRINSATGVTTR